MADSLPTDPLPRISLPEALRRLPGQTPDSPALLVKVAQQRLYLFSGETVRDQWPVSTAAAGTGNRRDSLCTPTGLHRIAECIGDGLPSGAVLQGRKPTGELARIENRPVSTGKDEITSRILWLEGLEEGCNRGGELDSKSRHIYIHGTPEEGLIGTPASHGCIRLRNADIIALWERVAVGTPVLIDDGD